MDDWIWRIRTVLDWVRHASEIRIPCGHSDESWVYLACADCLGRCVAFCKECEGRRKAKAIMDEWYARHGRHTYAEAQGRSRRLVGGPDSHEAYP